MNTEIKSVIDILKDKFPNAEQLDWFIPIKECVEAYHNQFKSEPVSEDKIFSNGYKEGFEAGRNFEKTHLK
jgi:hypothetical protein